MHRLANELAQRGHSVDVVHSIEAFRVMRGGQPSEDVRHHPGVRVHGLRSAAGPLGPLAMQQTGSPVFEAQKLRKLLAADYDVIHFHNISLMGGPDVLTYGDAIKLYTMHEYWLVCPTHVMYKFNRAACMTPSCLACTLLHKRPPQWWRYTGKLQRALRSVDALLAPNQFSIDTHRRMGLKKEMTILPLFVPPQPLARRQPVRPEGGYFLYVGRLERIKGLHTVLPAFAQDRRAELWIAGSGAQEAELRQLAAGNAKIRFLGHVPTDRLSEFYRNAIALIVPSLCYEVFPCVILEAFRQQTPVIVRKIGGLPEIVETSGGGEVFSDEAGLSGILTRLETNVALRDKLGMCAYESYHRYWTPDVYFDRYFSIIDGIAADK